MYYSMSGEVLQDTKKNGKERPWGAKKMDSQALAGSFWRLGLDSKAGRVQACGSCLVFAECGQDQYKKLAWANFCKDRLCPMCGWRRSMMLAGQTMQILHKAMEVCSMRFIFLTLTVRNCYKGDLSSTIDAMFKGYKRLIETKAVDDVVVGWVRCLEVTRNGNKTDDWYDTYHPHFHVLLGLKPSYFKGKEAGYIRADEWGALWAKALRLDYVPSVKVQIVKAKKDGQTFEAAAVETTAKYVTKVSDYILDDEHEQDDVVRVLNDALKGRRLIGYGKLFRTVKASLKLADVEADEADLVGEGKERICICPLCGGMLEETLYNWHMGYKNYLKAV